MDRYYSQTQKDDTKEEEKELDIWRFLLSDCHLVNQIIISGEDCGYFGLLIIGMKYEILVFY
jgi:hypothetical protein